jgi:hypothetical protein
MIFQGFGIMADILSDLNYDMLSKEKDRCTSREGERHDGLVF